MADPGLRQQLDAGLPVTPAGAAAKLRNPALPDLFFNEA